MSFENWLVQVKAILIQIGVIDNYVILSEKAWQTLYNDGLKPMESIEEDMDIKIWRNGIHFSWVKHQEIVHQITNSI